MRPKRGRVLTTFLMGAAFVCFTLFMTNLRNQRLWLDANGGRSATHLRKLMLTVSQNNTVEQRPSGKKSLPHRLAMLREAKTVIATKSTHVTQNCVPIKHIAFIKVHKCASSTVASVIQKFGLENHVTFALPKLDLGHVGWPQSLRTDHVYRHTDAAKAGLKIDMLVHHSVYNATTLKRIMADDVVYVTILRNPFDQFASALNFFNAVQFLDLPKGDRVYNFLSNPDEYERAVPFWFGHHNLAGRKSVTRNMMATDLGYPTNKFHDVEFALEYIDRLDKAFILILIKEHLHESLVLLRRKLCWKMENIFFQKLNSGYSETLPKYSEKLHGNHKNWSIVDYLLYGHFKRKLFLEIEREGRGFHEEVKEFIYVNDRINSFCAKLQNFGSGKIQLSVSEPHKTITIPASTWNAEFTFTEAGCIQLSKMPWQMTQQMRRHFDRKLSEKLHPP